jgi:phytanoyl-CoA hydroxylase
MTQNNTDLKKQFEDEGYIMLRGAIPERDLVPMRKLADKIDYVANENPDDLFCNYYMGHRADQGTLYDLFQRFPEFAGLARHEAMCDAISAVYSPNFYMYENCLVYKPQGKANGVPWHQDFISRTTEPIKVIAWMALDDVDEENGCMYAIPGTHKLGFLPYKHFPGETHHDRLDLSQVDMDEKNVAPLRMKAGDILVFHQLMLHMSKEINSTRPRRAYRVSYQDFNQSFTPRGTPMVIRMDDKSVLSKPYQAPPKESLEPVIEPTLFKRGLHKIGRKLLAA